MKKELKRSEEGEAEKEEENLREKLRRGVLVGKIGGPCTPVSIIQHNHHLLPFTLSARKLAAALWEFHHCLPLFQMHHNGDADPTLRRHHYKLHKDKAPQYLSNFLTADASPNSLDHQPASASSLRRHVAASLMQHNWAIERNNDALQPVSPTSYGSSMEMAPYNPAATPTSSLEFKGRIGESHYSLKTSTELLKVLNRIWSLEEQHASNISLIKALKSELHHARIRIKELLRDCQADRHEIDDLMKQIAEDKLVRKSKEQDRVHAAVQSVRDELEDERKLRKQSESIHRKLARELSELKSSLNNSLKEIERERKTRKLLEDLCDEFARETKDYEHEVHALKQKSDKDCAQKADHHCMIRHISESWLDERMQMQLEAAENGFVDKKSIVDRLSLEIETFLKAKQNNRSRENPVARDRQNSLESVPLNDATSAPQDVEGNDSVGSYSNCLELNKLSNKGSKVQEQEPVHKNFDQTLKYNWTRKKANTRDGTKNLSPSSMQVNFREQMAWAMSSNSNKKSQTNDAEQEKITDSGPPEGSKSENCEYQETKEEDGFQRKPNPSELHSSNKNHIIDNLIGSQVLASDSDKIHAVNNYGEASCSNAGGRNQSSPMRQWLARLTSQDLDISKSVKVPSGLKENTLKAKLLEARSLGQRSRLKTLKGIF